MDAPESFGPTLDEAATLAGRWLAGMRDGRIPATATADEVKDALGRALPDRGAPAPEVLRRMAGAIEPGLLRIHSPRFHGWVMGGAEPASLGADWLVAAWDQNAAMRAVTPGVAAAEELAEEWLIDLFGLPSTACAGFVTGATAANGIGLTCGRDEVLRRVGWDTAAEGLGGGPRIRFVAGAERHGSVDSAARLAGLGQAELIDADDQGRIRVDALREALDGTDAPTIVSLQAGNLHSGAFDHVGDAAEVAHRAGAWVHVDGAFGLWAAAAPGLRHLTSGLASADSWATDAHKTLNVPYDSGIAVVADAERMQTSFGMHGAYLTLSTGDQGDRVPEMSRRARGVPVYAALAQLGRLGVAELVQQLADSAHAIAEGLRTVPGTSILNDVVYTQVCASFGSDARTKSVGEALLAGGAALASASRWHDQAVLRFSVSNWLTDRAEAERTVDAVRAAVAAVGEAG